MRLCLDALFKAADPVVAVHHSRHDADASLEALRRCGYGRRMLTVVGQSGSTLDADRLPLRLGTGPLHWAASGLLWGMLWAAFTVAAVFLLPAGGSTFDGLMTIGALALVLQTAVVARIVAPERGDQAPLTDSTPTRVGDELRASPWRFLVVVRGTRSDIALARDILAID